MDEECTGRQRDRRLPLVFKKINTSMLDYIFHLLFPLGANFHTMCFLRRRWKPHRLLWQLKGSARGGCTKFRT